MTRVLPVALLFFLCAFSTRAQLTKISSNTSLDPIFPLTNGKTLLISEVDSTLWASDGTMSGTVQLSSTIFFKGFGAPINGQFVFSAFSATTGTELFITDGSPANTVLLADINPGAGSSTPDENFVLFNNMLYFTALRPAEGRELWRTDGTTAGTTLFKDIAAGAANGFTADAAIFTNGSALYFAATTAANGTEPWISDGTAANTVLLKDVNTGAASSSPTMFFALNNKVIFQATTPANGTEFWVTDGTTTNTMLLADINPGPGNMYQFFNFTIPFLFNNKAFFTAYNPTYGEEVWMTDGTPANTMLLKDIQSAMFSSTLLSNAVKVGNKFFFSSSNLVDRFELWESDGTPAGTVLFKSFSPSDASGSPYILPPFSFDGNMFSGNQQLFQGNKFFFTAGTAANGIELWVSDGTLAGTNMVKDIQPGAGDGLAFPNFIYSQSKFYFVADNGTHGDEVWQTDGTNAGTTMLADIFAGSSSSEPQMAFFISNNKLFITANDGDHATLRDLFVLDGVLPLPLSLLNFTVKGQANDALLQWTTTRELNMRDFVVQRSYDGRSFSDVGTVSATGTQQSTTRYAFTDGGALKLGKPALYYRLRMRNRDGSETVSSIISLRTTPGGVLSVRLTQNPVGNQLGVIVSNAGDKTHISIRDLQGRMVTGALQGHLDGFVNIDISKLAAGNYVLVVENGVQRQVVRFVKQ